MYNKASRLVCVVGILFFSPSTPSIPSFPSQYFERFLSSSCCGRAQDTVRRDATHLHLLGQPQHTAREEFEGEGGDGEGKYSEDDDDER